MRTLSLFFALSLVALPACCFAQVVVHISGTESVESTPRFADPAQFRVTRLTDQDEPTIVNQEAGRAPSLRVPVAPLSMSAAVRNNQDFSSERAMFQYRSSAFLADPLRATSQYQANIKTWESPNSRSRPLYFEDPNLERYGNHRGPLQPLISGTRFMTDTALLPYKMVAQPSRDCHYSLGHLRPGNCNPSHTSTLTIDSRALAAQSLVVVGLAFGL